MSHFLRCAAPRLFTHLAGEVKEFRRHQLKRIHDFDARRLGERIVKVFRVKARDAAFHARRDDHRVPKRKVVAGRQLFGAHKDVL